jgi:electron transport complex protein RnfB
MLTPPASSETLAQAINAALPQTQCTRCGFPDCRSYAQAIAQGQAEINQCPPGGQEGVDRLARITGRSALPLNPAHGQESERTVALIDEDWCIGCTLCIKACPVDSIVGVAKSMHTVIESNCTGCELCIPVCPVDCISLESVTPGRTGWKAWSEPLAAEAKNRYEFRLQRLRSAESEHQEHMAAKARAKLENLAEHSKLEGDALERKRQIIEAAIARSRLGR